MQSLSSQLFRTIPEGFFRLLVNRLTPVYVDCANALENAAGEAARIELSEARAVVIEVVSSHAEFAWPEEEAATDIRVRAGKVFNQLLEACWLEDRPESLHERWVVISPALRPLLNMLRELAADSIAELKTFADTLEGVCRTLEADGVLDPGPQSSDGLRATINDLNNRLGHAIIQLHSVEKIVHGFEQRQMQTRTGAQTLQLFYGDFYEGHHMVCHEVLHRRGLLSRLHQARDLVRNASENPFVKERLAEGLCSNDEATAGEGWRLAGESLARLLKALAGIRQRADAVDARIASFHQLSRQRFFYQSQMRGRRPEMARQLCEAINEHFAGKRFSDLDESSFTKLTAPWRGLLAAEVEIFHGTASLRSPRRSRQPVSLALSDAKLALPDETEMERLREHMRVALTPARAARLVRQMLSEAGAASSTDEVNIDSDEMLLDLMAAASFNQAFAVEGILRWQITLSHHPDDFERASVPRDVVAGWQVERFTLTRTT
ncbi:MAG: DUF5716 family protein [Luteolibacter sp.]